MVDDVASIICRALHDGDASYHAEADDYHSGSGGGSSLEAAPSPAAVCYAAREAMAALLAGREIHQRGHMLNGLWVESFACGTVCVWNGLPAAFGYA